MLDLAKASDALDHLDPAIKKMAWDIVDREGGLVDNKNDSGGVTNYGVSLKHARAQGMAFDIDRDGDVDGDDIRLVTPEIAVVDFLMVFFVDAGLAKLPACIQACVFDHSVNGGPAAAVRLVQQSVNALGASPRLVEDGRIGPNTILAAHRMADQVGAGRMLASFVAVRVLEYQRIASANPKNKVFLKGWLARANSFLPKTVA